MASLRFRLLEWFADSSPRVQYPVPRTSRPDSHREEMPGLAWRHSMPLSTRMFLALVSMFVIVIVLPIAALLLLALVALIRSFL